jgi:hypothetical protein
MFDVVLLQVVGWFLKGLKDKKKDHPLGILTGMVKEVIFQIG